MKKTKLLLKVLLIAFLAFVFKHALQAMIEWTDVIPVRPKAYIWGNFGRSQYYFVWQFVYASWVFIVAVALLYLILKKSFLNKVKTYKITVILSLFVFLFLLQVHKGNFPYKKVLSMNNPTRFNYEIIEDFILYSMVGLIIVYLIRKWLLRAYKS